MFVRSGVLYEKACLPDGTHLMIGLSERNHIVTWDEAVNVDQLCSSAENGTSAIRRCPLLWRRSMQRLLRDVPRE